jgi:hypothetical protein
MPWKECSVMDERLQLVAERCREYGISRKTGLKYDLRYPGLERQVLEPLDNPFGSKLLPMS